MMEFCEKHGTKWDSNKYGDCHVCYAEMHLGGRAILDWHAVALRLGEQLADAGPVGYYDFKPYQWLEYAEKSLKTYRAK